MHFSGVDKNLLQYLPIPQSIIMRTEQTVKQATVTTKTEDVLQQCTEEKF
jgi:hypothetical protein